MNRARTRSMPPITQILAWVIGSALVFSGILYVYFVFSMAVYAAEQGHIAKNINMLRSEVSDLEAEYLKLGSKITLAHAYELGLEDTSEITFATRKTLVRGTLSRENEI